MPLDIFSMTLEILKLNLGINIPGGINIILPYGIIFIALFILSPFIIFFYGIYRLNLKFKKISTTNYLKATILKILPNLPSKWFDWLKFVLIIGTLSLININYENKIIMLVAYISYLALFLDFYFFIYDSIEIMVCNPQIELLTSVSRDQMTKILNVIKRANNSLKINGLDAMLRDIEDEEDRRELTEKVKKFILEDITQYKSTSALNEYDRAIRLIKDYVNTLITNQRDLEQKAERFNRISKIIAVCLSAYFTFLFYILINYFLNLYISHNLDL